jgi:hypothetical protein
MIRQAISCDLCGAEKRQTNHWFVAYEQGEELRISGWSASNRLRPGTRHLCGQTCLHKLVDDFMARALAGRIQPSAATDAVAEEPQKPADTSLTSNYAYEDIESSARVITPPLPLIPRPVLPAGPVPVPARLPVPAPALTAEEAPSANPRNWRAEAWERERERELRAAEHRHGSTARRRSGS